MKKIVSQVIILVLLGAALPVGIAIAQCQQNVIFNRERTIDTTNYIKHHDEVDDQQAKFKTHFKHQSATLNDAPEPFVMGAMIDSLYRPTTKAMAADADCSNKRCIAAVKISYGLNGNKMKMLYQPLYLKLRDIVAYPKADSMRYWKFVLNATTYEYTGSKFVPVKEPDIDRIKNKYRQDMRKHPSGTGAGHRLKRDDPDAIIFSFQELVKFYDSVYKNEKPQQRFCEQLEIHNGCAFYTYSDEEIARHTLFVTKKDWVNIKIKGTRSEAKTLGVLSEDEGANLAHLCPPRCESLSYPQ